MHKICTRNCFFGEFAKAANCAHPMVYDLEKQWTTWNVSMPCDLSGNGKEYIHIHTY